LVELVQLDRMNHHADDRSVQVVEAYRSYQSNAESIVEVRLFQSKTEIFLEITNLDKVWTKMCDQVFESLAFFQTNGSGWTFHWIVDFEIHTEKYKPLCGSPWIPMPKFLAEKKALINMKNKDNQCFKWSVARKLNAVTCHAERREKHLREQVKSLNIDGIEFPVELKNR